MADPREKSDSVLQKVKGKAQEVQSGLVDRVSDASAAGMEKLKDISAELDDLVPLIGQLGYAVERVQIGIGVIPDVAVQISGLTRTMDESAYNRILEEQKEKKVLCAVLRALQTASIMQQKIQIVQMRSDTATITLSIPPKISLDFRKSS